MYTYHYQGVFIIFIINQTLFLGFDAKHYTDLLFKTFGPGTAYDNPGPTKYIVGAIHETYPVDGPWRNRSIRRFCDLHAEGKTALDINNDDWPDPDCVARIVAVVLMWAG